MTTHSTIYVRCPSCRKDGLVQPVQATYRCAVCNFDYMTLAKDQAAREAWMLENLRLGPMNALFVMHLYRLILAVTPDEARAQVMAFAEQNGIKLPTGKMMSPRKIVALAVGGIILFAAVLALIGYFFT